MREKNNSLGPLRITSSLKPFFLAKNLFLILKGGRACHALGEEVIKEDGVLVKVEDLKVGDHLLGPDGTPREILELHTGEDDLYRVKQFYGEDYVVNSNHILSLKRATKTASQGKPLKNGGYSTRYDFGDYLNMNVVEYMNTSDKFKTVYRGWKATDIDFPEQGVPIDPYFLGLWLGDGHSHSPTITTEDQEVVEYVKSYAASLGMGFSVYTAEERTPSYGIVKKEGNLTSALRDLGIHSKKRIPQLYLHNSRDTRLKLLAGLVDSDGYMEKVKNSLTITQKSEGLARDIKLLADSLGFQTSINSKIAKCQTGAESKVWLVKIAGNLFSIPAILERKKPVTKLKRELDLTSIKVVPEGRGKYVGFTVDKDNLYLLKDYTVTHNSGKTKSIAIFLIELARITSSRFLCLRQLQSRISESVYTVLKQTIFEQGYDQEFEILKSTIVHRSTGSEFVFMGMQRNILEIKGVEDISYCWIEEGEGLTKEQWSVISPTIRKEGSRILISLNPKHTTDFVLDELPRILGDSLLIRHINYDENAHLSKTMVDKIEQLKKTDYEAYRHIYLGEPLDSNENAIITASSLRAVISDDIPQEHYDGKIVMGFDIADSGEDKCAVVVRQGSVVTYVEEWKGEVDGILKSVTKAYSIAKKYSVSHIIYDSIGVGASAGAKLTEIDSAMRHTGWNAGRSITNSRVANRRVEHTKIKNKDFYANVKAMAWWDVSRMIVNKDIHIDKNKIDNRILEQLIRELTAPMKDFDNNGRVKVESKNALAKRGIASPNMADAFIMAFVGENQEGYSWNVFKGG